MILHGLLPTPPPGGAPTQARAREAARAFEAQVFSQLLRPAFEGAAGGAKSPFGGGAAEAQWRPALLDAFAAEAARSGRGLGLQETLLRHMLRTQESGVQESSTSAAQDRQA